MDDERPLSALLSQVLVAFAIWLRNNVRPHRVPGYAIAVVSLKEPGRTPGDASSDAMDLVADLVRRANECLYVLGKA